MFLLSVCLIKPENILFYSSQINHSVKEKILKVSILMRSLFLISFKKNFKICYKIWKHFLNKIKLSRLFRNIHYREWISKGENTNMHKNYIIFFFLISYHGFKMFAESFILKINSHNVLVKEYSNDVLVSKSLEAFKRILILI